MLTFGIWLLAVGTLLQAAQLAVLVLSHREHYREHRRFKPPHGGKA